MQRNAMDRDNQVQVLLCRPTVMLLIHAYKSTSHNSSGDTVMALKQLISLWWDIERNATLIPLYDESHKAIYAHCVCAYAVSWRL